MTQGTMPRKKSTVSKNKPSARRSPALSARELALDVLLAVIEKKQPLDHTLDQVLAGSSLPARDLALARSLTYIVLRRRGSVNSPAVT